MNYKLVDLSKSHLKEMDHDGVFTELEDAETYAIGLFHDTTPIGIFSGDSDITSDAPTSIVYGGNVYSA